MKYNPQKSCLMCGNTIGISGFCLKCDVADKSVKSPASCKNNKPLLERARVERETGFRGIVIDKFEVEECLKKVYEDIELTMGRKYHSSGTRLTYKEARRLVLRTLRKRFGELEEEEKK